MSEDSPLPAPPSAPCHPAAPTAAEERTSPPRASSSPPPARRDLATGMPRGSGDADLVYDDRRTTHHRTTTTASTTNITTASSSSSVDTATASAALWQKWTALRATGGDGDPHPITPAMPSGMRGAAAIFIAPTLDPTVRADEARVRHSPPLQPLYTVEPLPPWAGGGTDARAGWGRGASPARDHAGGGGEGGAVAERTTTTMAGEHATCLWEGRPPAEPLPGANLGWLDDSAAVDLVEGGGGDRLAGDVGPAAGGAGVSAVERSPSLTPARSQRRLVAPGRCVPLECVAAQPIPLPARVRGGEGGGVGGVSSSTRCSTAVAGAPATPAGRRLRSEDVPAVSDGDDGSGDGAGGYDDDEGRIFDGDLACTQYVLCCCCCCWGCGGCASRALCRGDASDDGSEHAALLARGPSSSAGVGGWPHGASSDGSGPRGRAARRSLYFLDVFRATAPYNVHLPAVSRVYALLHYTAALTMLATVTVVAACEARRDRPLMVQDGTACTGHTFHDRLRPDLSSSLCSFVLNALFAVWFALRAARYEKSGFLVAAGVVVGVQLARAVYFILYVAPRYAGEAEEGGGSGGRAWPRHLVGALLALSVTCSLTATAISVRVRRAFGWRSFTQGITQPLTVALRRRYMRLQTCLQLEGAVAVNAYLAIVFLVDDWRGQLAAALVAVLVIVTLSVLPPLLRAARRGWPLVLCLPILVASLISYIRVMNANVAPVRPSYVVDDRAASEPPLGEGVPSPAPGVGGVVAVANVLHAVLSDCYTPRLMMCLARHGVYITQADSRNAYDPLSVAPYPAPPLTRARPENGTSTYLPTGGTTPGEYFLLQGCHYVSCYLPDAERFSRVIGGCCVSYGRCARKETYRVYGVALLAVLSATAFACLVTLTSVAWRRILAGDDAAIATFLRSQPRPAPRRGPIIADVETTTAAAATLAPAEGVLGAVLAPTPWPSSVRDSEREPRTPPVSRRLRWSAGVGEE